MYVSRSQRVKVLASSVAGVRRDHEGEILAGDNDCELPVEACHVRVPRAQSSHQE